MLLGAIVIIVTGVLIVNYFDARKGETIPAAETENSTSLPATHIIAEGEDLWKISEKYYGSGYNWIDIAKENNISNPDQIAAGDELSIPDVQPRLAESIATPTSQPEIVSPTLTQQRETEDTDKNIHKVAMGENLWEIAEKYYGSGYNWVDIAKENNLLSAGQIVEGQELVIPEVEVKAITFTEDESSEPISGTTYTVIQGDSLWEISVRSYGDGYRWVDIANENDLVNPNIIHPGNILTLPR